MKVFPLLAITIALFFTSSATSQAANFKFARSKEATSEDLDLDFTPEKTKWEYGKVYVWGTVRNKSHKNYKYVKVIFSAWGGRGGDLLTRTSTYTEPNNIGPGQIGYIEDSGIDCGNVQPNLIEYQVTGDM